MAPIALAPTVAVTRPGIAIVLLGKNVPACTVLGGIDLPALEAVDMTIALGAALHLRNPPLLGDQTMSFVAVQLPGSDALLNALDLPSLPAVDLVGKHRSSGQRRAHEKHSGGEFVDGRHGKCCLQGIVTARFTRSQLGDQTTGRLLNSF